VSTPDAYVAASSRSDWLASVTEWPTSPLSIIAARTRWLDNDPPAVQPSDAFRHLVSAPGPFGAKVAVLEQRNDRRGD
jgi:hypothetical protein